MHYLRRVSIERYKLLGNRSQIHILVRTYGLPGIAAGLAVVTVDVWVLLSDAVLAVATVDSVATAAVGTVVSVVTSTVAIVVSVMVLTVRATVDSVAGLVVVAVVSATSLAVVTVVSATVLAGNKLSIYIQDI